MAEPDSPADRMFYDANDWHFPGGLNFDGEIKLNSDVIAPVGDELVTARLDTGQATIPRSNSFSAITPASGDLTLVYCRPYRSFPVVSQKLWSTTTPAGATPTLVKYALFSVAANGDLTRIAVTANDTALLSVANTGYPKAYLAPANVVAGLVYAVGMLIVTAAAVPTIPSTNGVNVHAQIMLQGPRLCGKIPAQADIAASYTNAQVAGLERRMYAELLAA